jgi:hypothetical protein
MIIRGLVHIDASVLVLISATFDAKQPAIGEAGCLRDS